jgi:hypothetical protein
VYKALLVKKQTINNLINLALFQGVWFLTVIGAANNSLLPGLICLTIFFAVHYYFSSTAGADSLLAIIAVCTGLAIETAFVQANLLIYPTGTTYIAFVPVWVLILWANFSLIMNGCLSWLQGRYALAAVLAFLGAPLSYLGGVQLGAASVGTSLELLLLGVACTYAVITPFFLYLAHRLAGIRPA